MAYYIFYQDQANSQMDGSNNVEYEMVAANDVSTLENEVFEYIFKPHNCSYPAQFLFLG